MSAELRIAVAGAAGRLGRRVVALAAAEPGLRVSAALVRPGSPLLGRDAGEDAGVGTLGLAFAERPGDFDVLVDASSPDATGAWIELCRARGAALLVATTGHGDEGLGRIEAAARDLPLLLAPNLSAGAALMRELAPDLARRLGPRFDLEIRETHHRSKKDRPSGTALGLAAALAGERPSPPPIHSSRLGAVVGEHELRFASDEEELVLVHRALSRDVFARGALRGARWIAGRPPGLYGMQDLLDGR